MVESHSHWAWGKREVERLSANMTSASNAWVAIGLWALCVDEHQVEVESKLEILIIHLLPGSQQERNVSRRRNGYLVSTAKHLPMNAFLIGWRHWRQVLY